ncbi:secretin-like [Mobula hypostoma]|uniref:secretin-like n=1 Tax=Mobula hypostoma TaxID=723540 RepID=UPI002FC37000
MKVTPVLAGICLLTMTVLMSSDAQPQQTRHKRHADGILTSELSKMRLQIAAREFLKKLGVSRRSYEQNIVADENGRNVFCLNWIRTKLLTNSLSETEVNEAQLLCPIFTQMMGDMRQNGLPLHPI